MFLATLLPLLYSNNSLAPPLPTLIFRVLHTSTSNSNSNSFDDATKSKITEMMELIKTGKAQTVTWKDFVTPKESTEPNHKRGFDIWESNENERKTDAMPMPLDDILNDNSGAEQNDI